MIHPSRCRLVHDFYLLGADGKTKVAIRVSSTSEVIHALLHFRFNVAVVSAAIRKDEFSQCGCLDLCVCVESSEVEHSSICSVPVLQLDAIVIILCSVVIVAANTMLKRVGARTQPCFTPFVTGNESDVSALSRGVRGGPCSPNFG